jgi:hypothetical protein
MVVAFSMGVPWSEMGLHEMSASDVCIRCLHPMSA